MRVGVGMSIATDQPRLPPEPSGIDRRGRRRCERGGELGRELVGEVEVVIDGRVRPTKLIQESAGATVGLARGGAAPAASFAHIGDVTTNGRGLPPSRASSTGCGQAGRALATLEVAVCWSGADLAAFEAVRIHGQTHRAVPVRATQTRRRGRPESRPFGFSGAGHLPHSQAHKSLIRWPTVRPRPRPHGAQITEPPLVQLPMKQTIHR